MNNTVINQHLSEEEDIPQSFIFNPETLTDTYKEIAPGVEARRTKTGSIEIRFR